MIDWKIIPRVYVLALMCVTRKDVLFWEVSHESILLTIIVNVNYLAKLSAKQDKRMEYKKRGSNKYLIEPSPLLTRGPVGFPIFLLFSIGFLQCKSVKAD